MEDSAPLLFVGVLEGKEMDRESFKDGRSTVGGSGFSFMESPLFNDTALTRN